MEHTLLDPKILLATVIFAAAGILLLVLAVWFLDIVTPGKLWTEIIENKNLALAITAAGMMIGISIIIAASLHG